jgi:hypothetical protein
MTLDNATRTAVFWVLSAARLLREQLRDRGPQHAPHPLSRGPRLLGDNRGHGHRLDGRDAAAGRLLFVPISARLGARVMVAAVFLAQALGIGQLPLLGLIGTLLPFILLQGAANDMATLARATSLAEIFGSRHYGAIAGAVALGANGARAIGPVGASLLWVGLGSYPAVFWVLAASLVMAAVALLVAGVRATTGE